MHAPHYAPFVIHNGLVFISGQLPVIAADVPRIPKGIEAQTELVLEKLALELAAAGSDKSKLLQVRIYLSDIMYWDIVNDLYAQFMGAHKPARCIVPVSKLHFDCLIEIEAIAAL